ncbi:pre-mRNA-processing factor 39 isoform X1 [Oncorhynchus mykiss]|uniref:Pre-mRNA-processing factor 39 n=1 Tax=Oncorhynchus mykiss TaxID=8022 RepID=A0A8C7LN38_ONCMY|nr:pre-mRNA-processing factor 39 isoform X1 [Oncorhynchus mykiss]
MEDTDEPMTGMLDTDSSESGDSPAMEGNGDGFLPDLPVLAHPAEWTMDQVPPDNLTTVIHDTDSESDQSSPEVIKQHQDQQSDLGSVEQAVQHFQLASAKLFQEEDSDDQFCSPQVEQQNQMEALSEEESKEGQNNQEDATESLMQGEKMSEAVEQQQDPAQAQPPMVAEDGSPANMELEESKEMTEQGEPVEVPAEEPAVPTEPLIPAEYEKLAKGCEENPEDFNGWVYLLQYVEQENHLGVVRKAFDAFFLHYPYCYGYWKKFADTEKKHGNVQVAEEVYRRGVQAIPLSVDLWLHYMSFIKDNADHEDPETPGRIRAAYEHAVLAAGTDFRSDRLWEAYINWEMEQEKLANVTAIYDRILGIPTQLYSQHLQRFKEHVQNNNPKHFLSEEEFVQLRVELAKANVAAAANGEGEDTTPADELPPGTEDLPDPAKRVTEIENMRHKVIESRQEVFNQNEQEVSKRWAFEEGIKRPYFHVKALEKTQLSNWKEYLDYEIENGTPERVVVLFERCLIACALYEDFWTKYAKYIEGYSIDGVRHVYKKACTIHLTKKPNIHLLWAAFEEQQGNIAEARRILKALEATVPALAMVRLRRVSLERRHGNLEEAEALLREAIAAGKNTSETSFYAVKLARQLLKVQRSLAKARKVLLDAIEKDQASAKLYLNLLELEYSGDVQQNEADILACFDRALSSPLPLDSRLTFSQRKVEFLQDFGSDINKLVTAYDEHQKLLKENESAKRKAENGSQETESKRQRTDEHSGSGHMMQGDVQGNNSAYNYNWYQQQYNNWGQNSWGQYNQYSQQYNQYYPPPPT